RIGWGEWDGFTDDLDRIAYACRTPGGRLLFGGGGNAAYAYRFGGATAIAARPGDRAERFLRATMERYFPALAGVAVTHRWAGLRRARGAGRARAPPPRATGGRPSRAPCPPAG